VLFDDDVAYDSLALQWLAGHIKSTPAAEELRRAWSFCVYVLSPPAESPPLTRSAPLVVGQGVDLFAMPLAVLNDIEAFYHKALTYSPKWFYHDDVWISAYLHGAARVRVYRAQRGRDGKNCQQGKAVYDYLFLSRADGVGTLKGDLSRHTLNTELMQAREEMARDGLLPGARLQPTSDQWASDWWVRLHHGPRPSRRPA